jgi:transposase InsO family protein
LQRPNKGLVFHSDLGSQYTSLEFSKYAKNKGIIQSFSKKGCPYDNACIESFHAILKKEEVYRFKYFDYNSARIRLFEYIESWYNRKRIHGSICFMTPDKFEKISRVS